MIDLTDEMYDGAIIIDDMDDAIMGYYYTDTVGLVYSYEVCIELLQKLHNWNREDAIEWFDFNFSFPIEGGPIFVYEIDEV